MDRIEANPIASNMLFFCFFCFIFCQKTFAFFSVQNNKINDYNIKIIIIMIMITITMIITIMMIITLMIMI